MTVMRFDHTGIVVEDLEAAIAFFVDDVDEIFGRLQAHGGTLVGEIAEYEDIYRYGYVRGPAGVIVGLCQEL
jgi:predicted enzyme related to lactoylglutathione lyase